MFHLFLLIQIIALSLELFLQSSRQILTQNPIWYLSLMFYQFPLNLLLLCLFLIFVLLQHFQILVMLWFKKPVLILTHLILVLSQIQLPNVLFVTQKFSGPNAQTLIIHLSFCNKSQ